MSENEFHDRVLESLKRLEANDKTIFKKLDQLFAENAATKVAHAEVRAELAGAKKDVADLERAQSKRSAGWGALSGGGVGAAIAAALYALAEWIKKGGTP